MRHWVPPLSPHGLLQEHCFRNPWLVLVACLLLNCTSRKQVDPIWHVFEEEWATPEDFLVADPDHVRDTIRPLGFGERRFSRLQLLAAHIVTCGYPDDPRELPGVGEYAARAFEIFCLDRLGETCPNDGALALYWLWRTKHRYG